MEPASVALDIQALQEGSGADAARRRRVADLAGALARSGRLAAALIAPERPVPFRRDLPPELWDGGADLIRWDTRAVARRLVEQHAGLVHYVPAPLLYSGAADPGGMIVSSHWSDAGIPRVVRLDAADVHELQAGRAPRLAARLEWICASERVLVDGTDTAEVEALGIQPSRCLPATERVALELPGRPAGHLPYKLAVFGPFPPGGGGIGAYNAHFVEAVAASGRAQVDAVTISGMGWDPPEGVELIHAESFGTDVRPASYDWVLYTLGNSDGHLATVEAALRHAGWLWLHEARLPAVATTAFASLDDDRFAERMGRLLERAYPNRAPLPAARAAGRSHLALAAAGVGLTAPLAERAAGILVNSTAARHALDLDLPPLAWRPPTSVLPPACPPVPPADDPRPPADDPRPAAGDHRPAADDLVAAFGVVSMGKRPDLLVDAAALSGCRLAFVGPCPEILEMVIRDRATARGIADRVEVTGRLDDGAYWAWLRRATLAVQLRDSAGGEMSAAVLDALAAGVPVITNLPSAADYPPGTVRLIPDTSPPAEALAAAITGLLTEGDGPDEGQGAGGPAARREGLSLAGRRFAREHQMSHLADTVIAVLQSAQG